MMRKNNFCVSNISVKADDFSMENPTLALISSRIPSEHYKEDFIK
jgi:hypothetical protein